MNLRKVLSMLVMISSITLGANFHVSNEKTMAFEGSKVFKSSFNEYSKYGITTHTLKKFNKKYKTTWTVKNLSKDQAEVIYLKEWWDILRLEEVESQVVANNVYDTAVHAGHPVASKMLQGVLADLTWLHNKNNPNDKLSRIKIDGVIGSLTIDRLNYFTSKGLENNIVRRYKMKRLAHLRSLNKVKDKNGKTKWETFKDNWTKRVNGI